MKKYRLFLVGILLLLSFAVLVSCSKHPPFDLPIDTTTGTDTSIDSTGADESVFTSDTETDFDTTIQDESETKTEDSTKPEDNTQPVDSETEAVTQPPADDPYILRFGVVSDTHIGDPYLKDNMKITLQKLNELSGNSLDMMLFCGDLTESTGKAAEMSAGEITSFRSVYLRQMRYVPMVYCLGPTHDLPVYEDEVPYRKLYQDTLGSFDFDIDADGYASRGVRHAIIENFHVFAVDYRVTEQGVAWLETELEQLSEDEPGKPFFALLHDPTTYDILTIFRKYPNAIVFTGHFHNSLAREDSISQNEGCTQIHCGGAAYYRVDGYNRYSTDPFLNMGNTHNFAQALYVEVDKEYNVKITRVDAFNDAIIGEPWFVSSDGEFSYTNARKDEAKPSLFSDDATLRVKEQPTNGTYMVDVSFDHATMGDAGAVLYYRVEIWQKGNDGTYRVTQKADLASQQVFYPNDVGIPDGLYTHSFTNVNVRDYAVVVTAYDCWQSSGNALVFASSDYQYDGIIGGKIEHETSDENIDMKQVVSFTYNVNGQVTSEFSSTYTSMAVRFHPAADFTNVQTRCSSWGDEKGTLEFTLYKWDESYEKTILGEPVSTYTLDDFKGSTVYTVCEGTYQAGEYLLVVTTPDYSERVGVYSYPIQGVPPNVYRSYENGQIMDTYIYLGWSNVTFTEPPYITIEDAGDREPYKISFETPAQSTDDYGFSGMYSCECTNLDKEFVTFVNTGGDATVRLNQGIITDKAQLSDVVVIKYRSRGAQTGQLYAHITSLDGSVQYKYQEVNYEYEDDGEWHHIIIDAEAVWGKYENHNLNFVRLDMSNEEGSEVDIAYMMFFASVTEAEAFVQGIA